MNDARMPRWPTSARLRSRQEESFALLFLLKTLIDRLDEHLRRPWAGRRSEPRIEIQDRKSTRLNSSHPSISYAVFCLKKKIIAITNQATELRLHPVPMAAVSKTYIDQHSPSSTDIDEIANLPYLSVLTTGPNVSTRFL